MLWPISASTFTLNAVACFIVTLPRRTVFLLLCGDQSLGVAGLFMEDGTEAEKRERKLVLLGSSTRRWLRPTCLRRSAGSQQPGVLNDHVGEAHFATDRADAWEDLFIDAVTPAEGGDGLSWFIAIHHCVRFSTPILTQAIQTVRISRSANASAFRIRSS